MVALIVLAFLIVIFWFLFNRPRLRTGGWSGQRVYLRRGPGLGAVALTVIALVYLTDHASALVSLLLIVVGTSVVLMVLYFGARRIAGRGK